MFRLMRRLLTAVLDHGYGGLAGRPISFSPEHPTATPYLAAARRFHRPVPPMPLPDHEQRDNGGDATGDREAA